MSPCVATDKGHGLGTPGKETPVFETGVMKGKRMQEEEFNDAVGYYLDAELKRHGIKVVDVTPEKSDTPLSVRVKRANDAKADIYVSIHANASTGLWGTAEGIETFSSTSVNSKRLAQLIHKNLMKGTAMRDRGVKNGSHLYVIKYTKMPAILVECGFMDNLREAILLLSDAYRRECAHEILLGILEYFGMKFKPVSEPVKTFTPAPTKTASATASITLSKGSKQTGAISQLQNSLDFLGYELTPDGEFGNLTESAVKKFQTDNKLTVDGIAGKNTLAKIAELVSKKKEALVKPTPKKEEENVLYKVQAGAFRERTGAEKVVADLKKAGFPATIITEK
jgi:N-acetylmuramoyl-L-alanine amidase